MKRTRTRRGWAIAVLLAGPVAAAGAQEAASAQGKAPPFRFETLRVEPYFAERAGALASAVGFAAWPETPDLYMAPAVGRTLLREPAAVVDEVRSCTSVPFGDESWPQCVWSWKALLEGRKPSGDDTLDVQVTVAPSARAARELLLASLAESEMSTASLTRLYQSARRSEGPGDVAFLVAPVKGRENRLTFVRANVVFRLWGRGALSGEVLPLAARLDESLLAQQPLSLEELRSRRPKMRGAEGR